MEADLKVFHKETLSGRSMENIKGKKFKSSPGFWEQIVMAFVSKPKYVLLLFFNIKLNK